MASNNIQRAITCRKQYQSQVGGNFRLWGPNNSRTEGDAETYCPIIIAAPLLGLTSWRTMEWPLRHINCRNLTLESADKSTNMSGRIQDTTYFAVINDVFCRTSLVYMLSLFYLGFWRDLQNFKKNTYYKSKFHTQIANRRLKFISKLFNRQFWNEDNTLIINKLNISIRKYI